MKEIKRESMLELNKKGGVGLYFNSGYLNNSKLPFKDKSKPLIVGSCGTYRLRATRKLPTWSPRGRVDYQLLYGSAGKAHFYIGGEDKVVSAGHMVTRVLPEPRRAPA